MQDLLVERATSSSITDETTGRDSNARPVRLLVPGFLFLGQDLTQVDVDGDEDRGCSPGNPRARPGDNEKVVPEIKLICRIHADALSFTNAFTPSRAGSHGVLQPRRVTRGPPGEPASGTDQVRVLRGVPLHSSIRAKPLVKCAPRTRCRISSAVSPSSSGGVGRSTSPPCSGCLLAVGRRFEEAVDRLLFRHGDGQAASR